MTSSTCLIESDARITPSWWKKGLTGIFAYWMTMTLVWVIFIGTAMLFATFWRVVGAGVLVIGGSCWLIAALCWKLYRRGLLWPFLIGAILGIISLCMLFSVGFPFVMLT